MREYNEHLAELAQAEEEARRLASFRAAHEAAKARLDWAVGNLAAIQTRIAATRQRLERCPPEDRDYYQQELEDACQRLKWAEVVLIEAQGETTICAEELAEELALLGLSQEGQP